MIKAIGLLILLFISAYCNAQLYFGGEAGINEFSGTYRFDNNGIKTTEKGKLKTGFEFGGVVGYPICPHSDIETGLLFSMRGYKYTEDQGNTVDKSVYSIYYLEIPVIADYKLHRCGHGQPYIYGGPYVGFDIGGKDKWNSSQTINGVTTSTSGSDKLKFGNDQLKDSFRPFDYGIKLGAGYKLDNPLSLRLDYTQGLANTLPGGDKDHKYHNWGFTLSMTYKLNDKIAYTAKEQPK